MERKVLMGSDHAGRWADVLSEEFAASGGGCECNGVISTLFPHDLSGGVSQEVLRAF